MCVIVLGADHRILSRIRQLTILDNDLCPFALVHEYVVTARSDVTPVLQPADMHIFGVHLTLEVGLSPLLYADIFQLSRELDRDSYREIKMEMYINVVL